MLKIVQVGSASVGIGLLLAGGVIGWMKLHPANVPSSNSKGGSVVLDAASSPSPNSSDSTPLSVTSPDKVAAGGGAPNTLLPQISNNGGSNSTGNNSSASTNSSTEATPAPAATIPSPAEFTQYDKYSAEQTAYFGDEVVGKGAAVAVGSNLSVLYKGWLTDGTLFDQSTNSEKPFSFVEGDHKVIPGWEEGLMGMKVGGTRRLIVPPKAGYGAAGHSPIPPNAVLVFDVELLAIK